MAPPRAPSPPGYTKQRYSPRQPIKPLYGLSCCLLQYLQIIDTSKTPYAPKGFFSESPYSNTVHTNVYDSWSPDINKACGFDALTDLASIEIVIKTKKRFEQTDRYGILPHYTFVAEATLHDKYGRTLAEKGVQMKASVKHEVVVMGEKLERWDRITYEQVVNILRRAGKCKRTRFGEDGDKKEVLRVAKMLPTPVDDTDIVDNPVLALQR
jgi:hypothetical protein